MPHRGYVLIFIFWALLTIITPTLVFWSASAKQGIVLQETGLKSELKVRRMLDRVNKNHAGNRTETKTSAPAPAPGPVAVNATKD